MASKIWRLFQISGQRLFIKKLDGIKALTYKEEDRCLGSWVATLPSFSLFYSYPNELLGEATFPVSFALDVLFSCWSARSDLLKSMD